MRKQNQGCIVELTDLEAVFILSALSYKRFWISRMIEECNEEDAPSEANDSLPYLHHELIVANNLVMRFQELVTTDGPQICIERSTERHNPQTGERIQHVME